MSHLVAAESRTCSGTAHAAAPNRPNKLGIPHHLGFSDKLLAGDNPMACWLPWSASMGRCEV
jgi:hypothetical protein